MKTKLLKSSVLLFILTTTLHPICAIANGPPRFSVIDLGRPANSDQIFPVTPLNLNDAGQIVGYAIYTPNFIGLPYIFKAFVYSGGAFDILDPFPGNSFAVDINDSGQVLLSTGLPDGDPFLYTPDRGVTAIVDGRFKYLFAKAINNKGVIAGIAGPGVNDDSTYQPTMAFVYSNGLVTTLGTSVPGLFGANETYDINDRGDVVGDVYDAGSDYFHAAIFSGGEIVDLGLLPDGSFTQGFAINNLGHAVGIGSTPKSPHNHGFIYRSRAIEDLGTVPPDVESEAVDINDSDQVVGVSGNLDMEQRRAFLYSDGVMYDLNDLIPPNSGWQLDRPTGINNRGQIVGYGTHNGEGRGFLLTPRKKSKQP